MAWLTSRITQIGIFLGTLKRSQCCFYELQEVSFLKAFISQSLGMSGEVVSDVLENVLSAKELEEQSLKNEPVEQVH